MDGQNTVKLPSTGQWHIVVAFRACIEGIRSLTISLYTITHITFSHIYITYYLEYVEFGEGGKPEYPGKTLEAHEISTTETQLT